MIALILVCYAAVFIWSCRSVRGKKQVRQWLLLAVLLGWSAYVLISGVTGTPYPSISSPYIVFFQPIGKAIIHWLGG
ncbi:hypothetical protein [Fontibacillus panacisegetis]|uniref:hypothetical protein n=1 Tax=Fontibacillus panacisegetis TaxID=670482 RepID=UPI000B87DA00|nr:hypothetical protein [Fontibacillus panacisegetis]